MSQKQFMLDGLPTVMEWMEDRYKAIEKVDGLCAVQNLGLRKGALVKWKTASGDDELFLQCQEKDGLASGIIITIKGKYVEFDNINAFWKTVAVGAFEKLVKKLLLNIYGLSISERALVIDRFNKVEDVLHVAFNDEDD